MATGLPTISVYTTWRWAGMVNREDGTPITDGTVNYYLLCVEGAVARQGKWWCDSTQTWVDTEAEGANAMTHKGDGLWAIKLSGYPGYGNIVTAGEIYLQYAMDSADRHIPAAGVLVEAVEAFDNYRQIYITAGGSDTLSGKSWAEAKATLASATDITTPAVFLAGTFTNQTLTPGACGVVDAYRAAFNQTTRYSCIRSEAATTGGRSVFRGGYYLVNNASPGAVGFTLTNGDRVEDATIIVTAGKAIVLADGATTFATVLRSRVVGDTTLASGTLTMIDCRITGNFDGPGNVHLSNCVWVGTATAGAVVTETNKADVETIKAQAVTCGAAVTIGPYVGGPSNDLYVDPVNGNDALDGKSWTTAKLTAKTVVEAATAGQRVYLAAGTYTLGDAVIEVPDGVDVIGAGIDKTVITSTANMAVKGAIVKPGTGSYLAQLTIHGLCTDATLQVPLGFRRDTDTVPNQTPFERAWVEDVRLIAESDGVYLQDSTSLVTSFLVLRRVRIETKYDAVVLSTGSNTIVCEDCDISVVGPCTAITTPGVAGLRVGLGGKLTARRCQIAASFPTATTQYVYGAYASSSGRIDCVDCTFTTSAGGAGAVYDVIQPTGGQFMTLTNCTYDRTKTSGTITDQTLAALTAQGYTAARGTKLDNLDATITSRHASGAAVAKSPATIAAGDIAENAIDAASIKTDAVTKLTAAVWGYAVASADALAATTVGKWIRTVLGSLNPMTISLSQTTVGTAPTVNIDLYQYEAKTVVLTAETSQTGDTHRFAVYDSAAPSVELWNLTTTITEGGTDDKSLTVPITSAKTTTAGNFFYRLWNVTDEAMICEGALTISPNPDPTPTP